MRSLALELIYKYCQLHIKTFASRVRYASNVLSDENDDDRSTHTTRDMCGGTLTARRDGNYTHYCTHIRCACAIDTTVCKGMTTVNIIIPSKKKIHACIRWHTLPDSYCCGCDSKQNLSMECSAITAIIIVVE